MRRPCSSENEACPYYQEGCYEDVHHKLWPRRDYRRGLDRIFRNLPENKELLCRWEHDELHATQEPPEHPARTVMLRIMGVDYEV